MTLAWIGLIFLLGGDATGDSVASTLDSHGMAIHTTAPFSRGRIGGCVATTNFQVCCCGTDVDSEQVARSCEQLRSQLRRVWCASEHDASWTPRCQVVVHSSVSSYARQLGPGCERTSGCASLELDGGRVVLRRIDLRADARGWLTESLPHELTHVVLADRFSEKRIPRWADEGIAILSEPVAKQQLRERTWQDEARSGHQFSPRELFVVDAHPPANRHNAYYSQSASLVRFLIDRDSPEQFLRFVQASQRHGYATALKSTYGIDSVEHLEHLWAARRPAPNESFLIASRERSSRPSRTASGD